MEETYKREEYEEEILDLTKVKSKPKKELRIAPPSHRSKKDVEEFAIYTTYKTENGEEVTREHLGRKFALANTPEKYRDALLYKTTLIKVINKVMKIPTLPSVPLYKMEGVGKSSQLVNVINNFKLPTLDMVLQFPIFDEFTYTTAMKQPAAKALKEDLELGHIECVVLIYKDIKGQSKEYSVIEKDEKGAILSISKEKYVQIKFRFPYPDIVNKSRNLRTYNPSYNSVGYDKEFMHGIQKMLLTGKFDSQNLVIEATDLYKQLITTIQDFYFGSGTLSGQLTRLTLMIAQRDKYKKIKIPMSNDERERVRSYLVRFLPARTDLSLAPLTGYNIPRILDKYMITRNVDGKEEFFHPTFKVNMQANPGPLYSRTHIDPEDDDSGFMKRENTYLVDLLLATRMMATLDATEKWIKTPVKDPLFKPDGFHKEKTEWTLKQYTPEESVADFWKLYDWTRVFNWFPKAEVYERAKRQGKTRGISCFSSFVMDPARIFTKVPVIGLQLFDKHPYVWTRNRKDGANHWSPHITGSVNMLGFSVYRGGIQRMVDIIKRLLKDPKQCAWASVYADNLYVLERMPDDRVVYASADIVKAESCVSTSIVQLANSFLLGRFPAVSRAWVTYAQDIHPFIAANGVALIGNQQLPFVDMLCSGAVGTAFYNQVNSVRALGNALHSATSKKGIQGNLFVNDSYQQMANSSEFEHIITLSENLKKASDDAGIELIIEQSIVFDAKEISSNYLTLDMLGFNAGRFKVDKETYLYFPVLDYKRLLNALVMRKDYYDEGGEKIAEPILIAYLDLVRYRALVFMGAWMYPAMYIIILRMANKTLTEISRLMDTQNILQMTPDEIIEIVFDGSGLNIDIFMPLVSMVNRTALPTIYELVMVNLSDDKSVNKAIALRAVESRVTKLPYTYLAPREILEELGYKEYLEKELDLSPTALMKTYPTMDIAELLTGASGVPVKKEKIKPTKIEPKTETKPIAFKDVGKPKIPATKKQYEGKYVTAITSWVNRMVNSPKMIYRVPIPNFFLGRLQDVQLPKQVARQTTIDLITNVTGMTKDEAGKMIDPVLKKHVFTIQPILKSELEKTDYSYTEFEYDPRPLVTNKFINREFDLENKIPVPYVGLNTYGSKKTKFTKTVKGPVETKEFKRQVKEGEVTPLKILNPGNIVVPEKSAKQKLIESMPMSPQEKFLIEQGYIPTPKTHPK